MTQWFDETHLFRNMIEDDIRRISRMTHTPPMFIVNEYKETLMPDSNRLIPSEFLTFITPQTPASKAESAFRALEIQPGDRVRLTYLKPGRINPSRLPEQDASTLEGVVTKVKQKKGASKVQIAGFDTAGNGVFWPVADYRVEVLHRAYRWNDRDRVIAELVGGPAGRTWATLPETRRASLRAEYGPRADRIRKILGADTGVE